jgi:adenosine kinase
MEISTKSIIAIGNPIMNILGTASMETIHKYGLEWGKTVFTNESNEGFYEVLESHSDVSYIPGGSVVNSIRIASVSFESNR